MCGVRAADRTMTAMHSPAPGEQRAAHSGQGHRGCLHGASEARDRRAPHRRDGRDRGRERAPPHLVHRRGGRGDAWGMWRHDLWPTTSGRSRAPTTAGMSRLLDPARLGDHVDRLYRAAWRSAARASTPRTWSRTPTLRVLARPRVPAQRRRPRLPADRPAQHLRQQPPPRAQQAGARDGRRARAGSRIRRRPRPTRSRRRGSSSRRSRRFRALCARRSSRSTSSACATGKPPARWASPRPR